VIHLGERIAGGTVAIKLLRSRLTSEPEMLRRFEQERKIVLGLNSRYVAKVYDQGIVRGRAYIVMELVDGISLDTLVRSFGAQPASRVCHLLRQICESLEEAHQRNLVHRRSRHRRRPDQRSRG
jgi:serine/threonine-protein kinase